MQLKKEVEQHDSQLEFSFL